MSASVDEISNVVNGVDGVDDDDDDDEEEEEEDAAAIEKLQPKKRGFRKAKEVVFFPFTKAKNKIRRIRSRRALLRESSYSTKNASSSRGSSSSSSSGKVIVRGNGNRTENGNGISCKFCFSRPSVLDSGGDSSPTTSDPNDPKFTHAMLRALIENNDFYSKECNPHID